MKDKVINALPTIIKIVAVVVTIVLVGRFIDRKGQEAMDRKAQARQDIYDEAFEEGYMAAVNENEDAIEEVYKDGYYDGLSDGYSYGSGEIDYDYTSEDLSELIWDLGEDYVINAIWDRYGTETLWYLDEYDIYDIIEELWYRYEDDLIDRINNLSDRVYVDMGSN